MPGAHDGICDRKEQIKMKLFGSDLQQPIGMHLIMCGGTRGRVKAEFPQVCQFSERGQNRRVAGCQT